MFFVPLAQTALTVALSASTVTAPATATPADSVCTLTKVTGTVLDTDNKGKAGVWIQDGYVAPKGANVKTDDKGAFTISVDKKHKYLFVFPDSAQTSNAKMMGSFTKTQLQVKDCVATPITIALKPPAPQGGDMGGGMGMGGGGDNLNP